MTQQNLSRFASGSIAVFILLATAVLSPSIGATQGRGTPPAEFDNALLQDAIPWDLPRDAEKMVIHQIIDGDTVQLTYPNDDWYYPTRIIGIQAPEMDGPYTEEGCYGPEAKAYLAKLMPVGTEVYAQSDRTDEDRNGRRLRHIFIVEPDTADAYLVSEILVLGGFADARSYSPDDLYDDVLEEAEELARQEHAGLWNSCTS